MVTLTNQTGNTNYRRFEETLLWPSFWPRFSSTDSAAQLPCIITVSYHSCHTFPSNANEPFQIDQEVEECQRASWHASLALPWNHIRSSRSGEAATYRLFGQIYRHDIHSYHLFCSCHHLAPCVRAGELHHTASDAEEWVENLCAFRLGSVNHPVLYLYDGRCRACLREVAAGVNATPVSFCLHRAPSLFLVHGRAEAVE